jgi:hypothetical protein
VAEIVYKQNVWGHAVSVSPPKKEGGPYQLTGFCIPRPNNGDVVQLPSGRRFELSNVELCRDPADMWFADGKLLEDKK